MADTFSGATTISSGTVRLGNSYALQNSVVTPSSPTSLSYVSGIGQVTLAGLSGSANLTLQDAGSSSVALTLGNSAGINPIYSGNLTSANTLSKTGTNTQTLTGSNTFTGVTLASGTLAIGTGTAPTPLGTAPVLLSGGTLRVLAPATTFMMSGFGANTSGTTTITNNSTWRVNENTAAWTSTPITSGTLTLTDSNANEARSAFFNNVQTYANGFTAQFTYTASGGADGAVFMLQNATSGRTALGGNGGNLGYNGITPSAGIQLNIYTLATGGVGTAFSTNGTIAAENSTSPVALNSGDPIGVTITYNPASGGTITETLTDPLQSTTYTATYTNENLSTILGGGGGAYVGFSGATGPTVSTQTISNFSFTNIAPGGPVSLANNNVTLQGGTTSTVDLEASTTTFGTLSVLGGSNTTLNITGTNEALSQNYSVSFGSAAPGSVSLSGGVTFNIASLATLNLGSLTDNGTGETINVIGAGTLAVNSPAALVSQGTIVNVNAGTLSINAATALGNLATVNLSNSGTLNVGANQTISALNSSGAITVGVGTVNLNSGALTIGSTDGLSSSFGGTIRGTGSLAKGGDGNVTLFGTNSYSGGTTVSSGTLIAATTTSLGSNAVTLSGGTLRVVPSSGTTMSSGFGLAQLNGGATVAGNVLTLTTAAQQARSAFLPTGMPVQNGTNGFTATFDYTVTGARPISDGAAFVLQEVGPTALGTNGGNLGYGGIAGASAAAEFNIYPPNNPGAAVAPAGSSSFQTNGTIQTGANSTLVPFLGSGDSVQVSINYIPSTTTLSETFTDLTTTQTPVTINATVNLATVLGSNSAYVGFTGASGGYSSNQTISNFVYSIVNSGSTTTYANNLILSGGASSTVDVAATAASPVITMGNLQVNSGSGTTLNVTATTAPMGQAYGLTLGSVALGGNVAINVANNTVGGGNALGTLTLGALNDSGTARSITLGGPGAVTLGSAGSLSLNTVVNVNGGTLNANAAGALGTTASVNVATAGTLSLGANQTFSALNGAGAVNLNSNTLTVGSSDNLASSFSGAMSGGGSLRVAGTGAFSLAGAASVGNTAITVSSGSTLGVQPPSGGTVTAGLTTVTGLGATLNLAAGSTLDMASGTTNVGNFELQQESTYTGTALTIAGATLKFAAGTSSIAELLDNGPASATAAVSGTNTIVISPVATSLPTGTFSLIALPSGSSGLSGTFDFFNGTTAEFLHVGSNEYRLSLTNSATLESLVISPTVTPEWQVTAAGEWQWSTPAANWSNGNVPQGPGDAAILGVATPNNQTIDLDQPHITLGDLMFGNVQSGTYNIAGNGNSLTLDNGGPSTTATVLNSTNNNTISAPITFASNITADVAGGTSLTLSGPLSGSSSTPLSVNPDAGNTGTLILSASNSSLSSPITLNAGTLNFANGSLGSGTVTFAGSSTLQYASGNMQDVSNQIRPIPSGVVATIDTGGNNVGFGTGLTGSGGLTKAGAGMLTLTATNGYTGPTQVNSGTLFVSSTGSLSATSGITVGGAAPAARRRSAAPARSALRSRSAPSRAARPATWLPPARSPATAPSPARRR